MEDIRITELFGERNEEAIKAANDKYGSRCHRLALSILGDKSDAEETVSDMLLKAWQSIPPAKPKSLGAYLTKITRNLALNKAEHRSADKRGGGELPLVLDELDYCVPSKKLTEDSADARCLTELIEKFLSTQKADSRIIFLKRYWYMLSVSEIASECGFSESKVKVTLMRTRNALKDFLDREDFKI